MTSKERMITAIEKGKPDRLPVTVHQWQPYHLKHYMNGMSQLEAFEYFNMDVAYTGLETFEGPREVREVSDDWMISEETISKDDGAFTDIITITTPEGELSYSMGRNEYTTWFSDPLIKKDEDIEFIRNYMPLWSLDIERVNKTYDQIGDRGIYRGGVAGHQAGCWQDACCLVGTQEMIMATFDKPDWVHRLLKILLNRKLRYIEEYLKRAKYDLIETGGGAGSSTVISPKIYEEFCLPYDKDIHDVLHSVGHRVVYHTCGGMMPILDLIVANGCDASETLSSKEVGGDVDNPALLKGKIGDKVGLVGGMNQFQLLGEGKPEDIRKEVFRLFETFGKNGGYILSTCDHFFNAPLENLKAYADAARECVY